MAESAIKKSSDTEHFCTPFVPIFWRRAGIVGISQVFAADRSGMPVAKSSGRFRALRRQPLDWSVMDIRFVSSLTSEDEKRFAPALLKAVAALLDPLPIAYTVRIETTGADVFQHAHAGSDEPESDLFDNANVRSVAVSRLGHS